MSTVKQKPRVVHVLGALAAGGAERFVVELLCELKDLGYCVSLVVLTRRFDPATVPMVARLRQCGIKYIVGPSDGVGYRTVLWYRAMMDCLRPDVLHMHTLNTEAVEFLRRLGFGRRVWRTRTLHNTVMPQAFFKRLALRLNRAPITIACGAAASAVNQRYITGEITTIANGRRFSWPVRDPANSLESKKKLQLDTDAFHLLVVGRMDGASMETSQKGHDLLIRAWRVSDLSKTGAHLHFVGDGRLRSALEELAGTDNSVYFHGIQPNVERWLLACDAFVMPSRWEGLPIAGIEAIGTGLPCIFADIPELRELTVGGVYLVDVGNVASFAEILKQVRHDGRRYLEVDAIGIRERFAISAVAERYGEVYDRICRGVFGVH